MCKLIQKFFYSLIHSNIFISAAALLLAIETQIQIKLQPQWHPYLFLIFFATLFEYNLHRLITIISEPKALETDKHYWVHENKLLFYLIVALSVIGFIIALYFAEVKVLIALSPFFALTLLYSTPVLKTQSGLFRLREIPFLKIFLIALVWAVVTILLPVAYADYDISVSHISIIIIERFLFVLAITVPFDIRDMEIDKQSGLKTIPLVIGKNNAQKAALFVVVLFIIVSAIHYYYTQQYQIGVAMLLSGIITGYCLISEKVKSLPLYHYGVLDGMMLLQALLVIAASWCS